jgi:hypothetical protein
MNAPELLPPKFPLGRIVATPRVLDLLAYEDILDGIRRHQAGDWGTVSLADRRANDHALSEGTRILSRYRSRGVPFWIITETDCSRTTIIVPRDY